MLPIESLGLTANQWQFLKHPERYVAASNSSGRKLLLPSTRRQFVTARDILERLNGSCGEETRRGILLADDVGLGKTTVAALVAWVVASAGEGRAVRILAPNDVMMRRWEEELKLHVGPLQECARALDVRRNRVKTGRVGRLPAGSIQVVKHSYAAQGRNLVCDLLIIDEAHRAKGETAAFSRALRQQKKFARRVLILTATPFSIHLEELERMLTLIGGEAARGPVRSFSRALKDLYVGDTARDQGEVAGRLATKARAAVEALSSFVIRHGIDDLPLEQKSFGGYAEWNIVVRQANSKELELMLRMDRMLRVAKDDGSESSRITNDPRFHVGWQHFDEVRIAQESKAQRLAEPAKAVVKGQLKAIKRLLREVGVHPKMEAVAREVECTIRQGEKVVLFCDYHATAQELTAHLARVLPKQTARQSLGRGVWKAAWDRVPLPARKERHEEELRDTFLEWLCADLIRAQTGSWLSAAPRSEEELFRALRMTAARHHGGRETIEEAAQRLYCALLGSKSSRAVLKAAAERPELLPGARGRLRVLGVCDPSNDKAEESFFMRNQQPDTVISIFNSPFGPDVLVVTDKLSEGIDLHRYCRHLIHYELDPSPIRTVQRNGRLRRVNSWAAATGQPIRYAYPAFPGTRDQELVQIVKKRIDSFSLLLGGVQSFKVTEVDAVESGEEWRNSVIDEVKKRLAVAGRGLKAESPHNSRLSR